MTIKIRDVEKHCIIDIYEREISDKVLCELREALLSVSAGSRISINLLNINTVGNNFLEFLTKSPNTISLFNLSMNICILFFVLHYDKVCDLYMSENDFILGKRRIVNRRLRLCS